MVRSLYVLAGAAALLAAGAAPAAAQAGRSIDDICLARLNGPNGSMAAVRACKAQLGAKQGAQLQGTACSAKACLYRLSRAGAGTYAGSGYTLRIAWQNTDESRRPPQYAGVRGTLRDPQGRTTQFMQECGASCNSDPEWRAGAHRGASYKPIGDPTKPSYVVLRLPR